MITVVVLGRGDFAPRDICQNLETFLVVWEGGGKGWHQHLGDKGQGWCLTSYNAQESFPPAKDRLVPNVHSAKAEKILLWGERRALEGEEGDLFVILSYFSKACLYYINGVTTTTPVCSQLGDGASKE